MEKFKLTHPALRHIEGHEDAEWADESSLWVGGKMVVCPECQGTGTHVSRSFDDSRLVDSMREDGDYEGLEAYYNGAYDVPCTLCLGQNVILEPNWESVPEWAKKEMQEWDECERETRAIQEAERRMGA